MLFPELKVSGFVYQIAILEVISVKFISDEVYLILLLVSFKHFV